MEQLQKDGKLLKKTQMFVGRQVEKIYSSNRSDDPFVNEFMRRATDVYLQCVMHMKKKLPLDNTLLKSLSCIDPAAKGHSVTAMHLKTLGTVHMGHFFVKEQHDSISYEVFAFQTDTN